MALTRNRPTHFVKRLSRVALTAVAATLVIGACAQQPKPVAFNPRTCFEEIPGGVKGLQIIAGLRTEQSIVRDMVVPVCHAHALYKHMQDNGNPVNPGTVTFRVAVEYTGEVISATVEETTIQSEVFLRKVSDFIMDTDFVVWARSDTDTEFLYPVSFGYYR